VWWLPVKQTRAQSGGIYNLCERGYKIPRPTAANCKGNIATYMN